MSTMTDPISDAVDRFFSSNGDPISAAVDRFFSSGVPHGTPPAALTSPEAAMFAQSTTGMPGDTLQLQPAGPTMEENQRARINMAIAERAALYTPEQVAMGREQIRAMGGTVADWRFAHPALDDAGVARWLAEQELTGGQGFMRPGEPARGPEAFWTEAGRMAGHLLPSEGPDAISRLGASLQGAPPTAGGYSLGGKVVGSAATSLAAIFTPAGKAGFAEAAAPRVAAAARYVLSGKTGVPAAFGLAALRDAPELEEGAEGSTLERAGGALTRGAAEAGSEFLGTVFDIKILGGLARSIETAGRNQTGAVVRQVLRASAKDAGVEIGEEEFNLGVNSILNVAEGLETPTQALRSWAQAQPELIAVAGLAGGLTAAGGAMLQAGAGSEPGSPAGSPGTTQPAADLAQAPGAVPQATPSQSPATSVSAPSASQAPSADPTQRAADLLARHVAPAQARAAEAARARSDDLLRRHVAPGQAIQRAEQAMAETQARRRSEGLLERHLAGQPKPKPRRTVAENLPPQPAQVLDDGSVIFRGAEEAERFVAFRNERLEPGEPPVRAVEVMRGAEGSPWAVVPDTRLQEARARGERQTAEVSEFARQAARGAAHQEAAAGEIRSTRPASEAASAPAQPESAGSAVGVPGSAPLTTPASQRQAVQGPPGSDGAAAAGRSPDQRSSRSADPSAVGRTGPQASASEPAAPSTTVESPSTSQPPTPKDTREPWEMGRAEWNAGQHAVTHSGADSYFVRPNGTRILWPGTRSKRTVIDKQHRFEVAEAIQSGKPVPPKVLAEYPDLTVKPAEQREPTVKPPEEPAVKPATEPAEPVKKTPQERKAEREAKRAAESEVAEDKETPVQVGQTRRVAGEQMQAVRVRWGDQGVQHELWQSDDRERGAYRLFDAEAGEVVSIVRGPFATVRERWDKGITGEPAATTPTPEVRNGQEIWLRNRDGDGYTPTKIMAVKQMFGKTHVRLVGGDKWFKVEDLNYRTQPPERTPPKQAQPSTLKVGDRVTWESGGKTLTGTIRSDSGADWIINADQIATFAGGVPLGRVEFVPKGVPKPLGTPEPAPSVSSGETADVQDQARQPERVQPGSRPADEGTPRVAPGEPRRPAGAAESGERASPEPAPVEGESGDTDDGAGDRPRGTGRRGGRDRDGAGRAEPQREPSGERVEPGARGAREPASEAGRERPTDIRDRNHRIAPDDQLAAPGVVGKVQANIRAIKLLQTLESEGRNPTPDEKKVLAQYVGWGGVSQALDEVKGERWARWEADQSRHWNQPDETTQKWAKRWYAHYKTIRELLTKEEFRDAAATTLNAHYTSREVISEALWPIAERLGFKGGNVIETSAGIGHIMGLQPEVSANTSKWTAVEIDTTSARILRKLYPEARVLHTPFEKAALRNNTFDLVISNFPFASAGTGDARYPKDFALHNYFFARSTDLVRPGGLIVSITSDSSMDRTRSRKWRVWMSERADLVGAIRLPNNAFAANAGTEVTTDILIFRKKDGRPLEKAEGFIEAPMLALGKDEETELNEYFHRNPDMMLGRMSLEGTMYRDKSPALVPTPGDLVEKIKGAIAKLPEGISTLDPLQTARESKESSDEEYSFQLVGGKAGQVRDGQWSAITGATEPRARSYIDLRGKTLDLILAQLDETQSDAQVEAKRAALRKSYEAHTKKHGAVGDTKHGFLREDPDFSKVAALENVRTVPKFGKLGKIITKREFSPAAILTERTQHPVKPPESAETIDDAIEISLAWAGAVDTGYVARLLGVEESEARQQMLDKADVYLDPQTGMIVPSDEYLSGNVRDKLRAAEDQARHDPRYQRNVSALQDAQPEPVSIADVSFAFGARWVPVEAYNAYLKERFGSGATVSKVDATGALVMQASKYSDAGRSSNNDSMGGGGMKALEIMQSLIGLKMPVVYDTVPNEGGGTRQVKNPDNTIAAQSAAEAIRDDFTKWARTGSQAPAIEDAYNQTYNGVVARRWSAPNIKHYPGAATTIELRPHQKAGIRRGVAQSYLNAHSVGTGKTFVEITTAMEWRRLGLARKPLLVVQNATVEQVARSFAQLYPNARVLTPHKQGMNASERKSFLNRIATGDWDCVILPQSFYNGLKDDPGRVRAYIDEQIDKLVEAIRDAGGDPDKSSRNDDPSVKNLQKRLKSLKKELDALLARKVDDDALSFEQLGVDGLLVDEAHAYKKLQFFTEMDNVKGLDTGFSQRGLSMLLKARHVQERTGGRNTILLTGTPVTNTLAEAWSMMRYVRPDILRSNNIEEFDDFSTAFTLTSTETEMDAVGRFRETTRLREFVNVPELQAIWSEVADVVRAEDIDLPRPKIKGGGPTLIEIDPSPQTTVVMKDLIFEYESWERLPGKEKREQSHVPLTINTKARKAALDTRLLYADANADPNSKLNRAIDEINKRWVQYREQRLTQIVFADMFRSGEDGFNAFHEIRDRLVERGVPEPEIAIIHEHDTKARREALFERVNEGEVRVVMGTTEKLGVGVNIQTRLQALHHLDAPWRPSDMEQREGRIVRQGNLVPDLIGEGVEILRYGVKRTFDAGQYERLARKQKMINDVLSGRNVGRTVEDAGIEQVASFSEASAAFSGDPRVRQLAGLRQEIAKLEASERGHQTDIVQAQRKLSEWRKSMPDFVESARLDREFHAQHREGMAAGDIRTPDGKTDLKGFQKWIGEQIDQLAEDAEEIRAERHRKEIGKVSIGGIELNATVQGPGTDTGRLSRKFAGVTLWTHTSSGRVFGSGLNPYDNAENLVGSIKADFDNLPALADQSDRVVADRKGKIPDLEALTTKRFPQAERLDAARKEHDDLLAELEKEAKPEKADGSPTSAPDTGPERQRTPVQRFMDALDAMETSARDRRRRRQIPRGRDIGAALPPEELADAVIIGAAKLLKGTVKFGVWSKEMAAEFGKRIQGHIREVWTQSRQLAQDIADGLEHPEPTTERVKRRIADAEAEDKAPTPGSTPETRAVHIAYRAGLRAARDELPAIKAKLTDALKLKGKARADTIQGIRLEVRRLVEENLPIEYRGRFLPELTRAGSYGQLAQAVNKIRREVARSTAAQDIRQIRRMTKYARLLSPRRPAPGQESPRAEFNRMSAQVVEARDKLLRTGRGVIPTDELEAAAATIRELKEDMGSLIADAMALRKAIGAVKVQTAAEHAADLAAAVRAQRPSRVIDAADVRTGAAARANLLYTDLRNLTERLEGGPGISKALMFDAPARHHESYLSALRDSADQVDQATKAAGFKGVADAMAKLSGRRGGGVTQIATVTLGGEERTIARGELIGLFLMDGSTRARIAQGSPIQIARGRRRTPIQATLEEIDEATDQLSAKEKALGATLKVLIDSHRDALFEAHFRLKGFYPEEVPGYWPSKRNIRFSPNRGLPEGWRGIRERYMENVGFLQEREGGSLPFVIGDALTVALEHIDASLKVIHLAEMTRDAASVMLNPDVVAAVNERWGSGYNRAIEDYLRAISLAQEADMTTMGEFIRWTNSNLATAKLGVNPGSWLKQLGGIPRLAAQMPTRAFLAGLGGWSRVKTADLIRQSGYFWERYVGNIAGRWTPIGGESYADIGKTSGLLGLEDAAANMVSAIQHRRPSDAKAALDNLRHAAGTSLEVLNAFDAINAKIAYAGWLAEAKRKYPAWDAAEQQGWAMTHAVQSVRETQNSSSVLDAPLSGVRSRGNVGASLLIFTSDTLKARNRLEAAKRAGLDEFARHATAEAVNIVWSRGVSFGVAAGIAAAVIAVLGGDEDDWEAWRKKHLSLEKQLTYGASDLLSLADPVVLPDLLRMAQYPFEEINLPALEAISETAQSLFTTGRWGMKAAKDSSKLDGFMTRAARAANIAAGVIGINPVETVLGRILDQMEDLDEEKPRRRTTREPRERR